MDLEAGPITPAASESLDPEDWSAFRDSAHRILDSLIDSLQDVRDGPVWRPVPERVQSAFAESLPTSGQGLEHTLEQFERLILPYATGNIHPRFWGWVHGSGTPSGIVAEMCAAAMNSNCGGRDHGAIYVERCVLNWCKQMFNLPASASGLIVSGTSTATLLALGVARQRHAECDVRAEGVAAIRRPLVAFASSECHECASQTLEVLGLGRQSMRVVPVDSAFRMDVPALASAIEEEKRAGRNPFCVVGTAGTVNTGAMDDLEGIASLCEEHGLWFHADGAFGGLCVLHPELRELVKGIERADSISFDFHKWMHVPYGAGCVLVRDGALHRETYASRPGYLQSLTRGLAAGAEWPCDYGFELSRGFLALKVWFALKEHGAQKLGRLIWQNCEQARYLAGLVRAASDLDLLTEPSLNIVCFRYRGHAPGGDLDQMNREIVADLQEQGIAAPSTSMIRGKLAIRVAITNHRSTREDFDVLVRAVIHLGNSRAARV